MIYQSFLSKGQLVYLQRRTIDNGKGSILVTKAVQQSDGSWWQYCYYVGRGVGTPIRGVKRQAQIIKFVEQVKEQLK